MLNRKGPCGDPDFDVDGEIDQVTMPERDECREQDRRPRSEARQELRDGKPATRNETRVKHCESSGDDGVPVYLARRRCSSQPGGLSGPETA